MAASPPTIAGYRDLALVGSGGFSKVYTAYQERFARTVAVKVITVELSDDALRRFRREQLTAGQLDGHPHVIRVYESGTTDDGLPYLTMEYHEQGSLADRVRRQGPLPVAEVLSAGVKLACALEAAHRRGIVHRDVKPQNVLLSPFVGPILADFGIAAFDDARLQTITTEAFSVFHVAPEVLDGHPATPAADLYALVSTLYELLAGRAPYAGDDEDADDADTRGLAGGFPSPRSPGLLQYMRRVRTTTVPPVDRPDVPPRVSAELVALLAREPAARPPSALALAERLRALEAEIGLPPTPLVGFTSPPTNLPPPSLSPPDHGTPGTGAPSGPGVPVSPSGVGSSTVVPPPAGEPSTPVGVRPPPSPAPDLTATFHPLGGRPTPTSTGDAPNRRRPWVVGAGVAAVLVLTGAGAWALLGDDSGDGGPERRPTRTTAAAAADALPPCPSEATDLTMPTGQLGPGAPPTRLEVQLSDDGTAATVRWDDPNGGRNPYWVYVHCDAPDDENRRVVAAVAAGEATEATIDGLPLEHNYCFTVAVLAPDGAGVTATAYAAPDGTHYRCLDDTTR